MEREQQDDNYFCHQPSVQGNEKSNERRAPPIPQLHLRLKIARDLLFERSMDPIMKRSSPFESLVVNNPQLKVYKQVSPL